MKPRAWLLFFGLLAGCLRLGGPTPQIREYRLDYPPPAVTGTPVSAIVEVDPLSVAAIYDRQPIVYREGEYSTGTYFDSRWSAPPGNMVADLLVRDLSAAGLYRAVQRAPSLVASDYRITGDLAEIEERVTGSRCAAHLELRMLLVRTRATTGGAALVQRSYQGEEPCPCNQPARLAAAMSQVLAGISARLQGDVYEAIVTDAAAAHSRP